jgi:hypothetical protein
LHGVVRSIKDQHDSIMKLGLLPPAADPEHPMAADIDAIKNKMELYQAISETH